MSELIVRLTEAEHEALCHHAAQEGIDESSLAGRILANWLSLAALTPMPDAGPPDRY